MDTPQGPSPESLKHLASMLPSMVNGMKEKSTIGRGKPVGTYKARKCCTVCGLFYDKIHTTADVLLEGKPCEKCQGLLDDGYVALVCGDEYAFVKSPRLDTIPEKIVRMQPQNFAEVKKQFNAEWRVKEKDADLPTNLN